MREAVATKDAPQAIGPYSQAIRANGFIFLSGQVGLDPRSGSIVPGGVAEQTERALQNVAAILQTAGSNLKKVVKTTVFLKNMADFSVMNEAYTRFWKSDPPARATVAVAGLPKDALVEIDVIALE